MKIILSNQIEIQTTLNHEGQIIEQFTFDNPKYKEALQFGRSTYGIDKEICLIERTENNQLIAPSGIYDYLLQVFKPEVIEGRKTVPVNIPFNGTLRPYQGSFIGRAIDAGGGQR